MSPTNASTSANSTAIEPDPATLLEVLKTQLEQEQTKQDKLTRDNAALKEDILALEKGGNDVKQAVTAYGQAYEGLRKDEQGLTDDWTAKQTRVEAVIGQNKAAIDKIADEYDNSVTQMEQDRSLENKKDSAEKQLEPAKRDLKEKEDHFEKAMKSSTRLTQKFNEIKNLRKQIDTAEGQKQPATMYFLLRDIKKTLDSDRVVPPEELESKLTRAWAELKAAKDAFRKKKSESDDAKANFEAGVKTLTQLKQQRKEKILADISQYNSPATGPAVASPKPRTPP